MHASDSSAPITCRWSDTTLDPEWDAFLCRTPLGQYQQSSRWGQAKAASGWRTLRLRIERNGTVAGGWQLLWQRRAWGAVGYVSKGPVLPGCDDALRRAALAALEGALKEHRIHAVLLQPPDEDQHLGPHLSDWGFIPDPTGRVVSTTLVNDLRGGVTGLDAGLQESLRKQLRQASGRGLHVYQGTRSDLEGFFALMCHTCRRQRTDPHPSSLAALRAVWDALQPDGCRLLLANFENAPVAGLFCITFGRGFTLWKKGWNGEHGEKRPNELLTHRALLDAALEGFAWADFTALAPDIARTMAAGGTLSDVQRRGRDFFNIRFGGQARLLPTPQVLIRNPLARWLARLGTAVSAQWSHRASAW